MAAWRHICIDSSSTCHKDPALLLSRSHSAARRARSHLRARFALSFRPFIDPGFRASGVEGFGSVPGACSVAKRANAPMGLSSHALSVVTGCRGVEHHELQSEGHSWFLSR